MMINYDNRIEEEIPEFCDGRKLSELQKRMMWWILQKDPTLPSVHVVKKVDNSGEKITVSLRHINWVRSEWKISRKKGRPRGSKKAKQAKTCEVIEVKAKVAQLGIHIFDNWVELQQVLLEVILRLERGIEVYKEEAEGERFRLLYHRRETLLLRFKALFYAPLFDIGKLSEYDRKEHALESVIGRNYQSSTLNQFLGELERINAAESLKGALIPKGSGGIGYVDGVMIPYWTKLSFHKGYITMLGRIMAGSQAVITHNSVGYAVYFSYYSPDINLSPIILKYCREVNKETGIEFFVIDRAVNAVDNAIDFQQAGLGLLCMLDKNEYKGLESFENQKIGELDDGSVVYEGRWRVADPNDAQDKKNADPRIFVLVEEKDRVLVYWGNPKVKELLPPLEWADTYRSRAELQENSFKRMNEHGKLKINVGTKRIMGPDRHQERKREDVEKKLELAGNKVEKKAKLVEEQEKKIAESEGKGHGKRLLQRLKNLFTKKEELKEAQEKQAKLVEKKEALDVPKQRADRDYRKQSITTFRSLLLENTLISFLAALLPNLKEKISLDLLIELLFHRSGACVEMPSEIIYLVNPDGLSVAYLKTLSDIVDGITAMNIKCRGKPIRVRLKERGS